MTDPITYGATGGGAVAVVLLRIAYIKWLGNADERRLVRKEKLWRPWAEEWNATHPDNPATWNPLYEDYRPARDVESYFEPR
jgi:hypothetical protein